MATKTQKPKLKRISMSSSILSDQTFNDPTTLKSSLGIQKIHGTISKLAGHVRNNLVRINDLKTDHGELIQEGQNSDNTQWDYMVSLRDQIVGINNSLSKISDETVRAAALERNSQIAALKERRQQQQDQKRQAAETDVEDTIGDTLASTIKAPAEKMKKNLLEKLMGFVSFFGILIGGWLTNKSVDLINAFADKNGKLVNKIGWDIVKGLALISGGFALAKIAIAATIAAVVALIGSIGALLLNPATLIMLLAAVAGVGIWKGAKWFWNQGREFVAGGKEGLAQQEANKDKLAESGVVQKGNRWLGQGHRWKIKTGQVDKDGKEITKWVDYDELSKEQKKAIEQFKADEAYRKEILKGRSDEISKLVDEKKAFKKKHFHIASTGAHIWSSPEAKSEWEAYDQKIESARQKWNAKLGEAPPVKSDAAISGTSSADRASTIGPLDEATPTIVPFPIPEKEVGVAEKLPRPFNDLQPVFTRDNSNFYRFETEQQFNWVGQ